MSASRSGVTVRGRVTLSTFVVLALVLAGTGWAIDGIVAASAARTFDARIRADAESLAALTLFTQRGFMVDFDEEGTTATPFSAPRCGVYFQVSVADGLVGRSRSLGSARLQLPESTAYLAPRDDDDRRALWTTGAGPYEPRVRILTLTVAFVQALEGAPEDVRARAPRVAGVVQVARSLAELEAFVGSVRLALAVALPLALVLGTCGAFFVAWRATAPILRLGQEARRIGTDSLDARLDLTRVDGELFSLADALNSAFERLGRGIERERRFSADAAHELRTPLTLCLTAIDVTLSRPRDAEDYRAAVGEVREAIVRLENLVGSLLLLTRAGGSALAFVRLDLRAVALEAVASSTPMARAAGVEIAFSPGEDEVIVAGDAALLGRMTANLVENAIRHGASREGVQVEVRARDGVAELVVRDQGPGIAADLLPRLFERFARADSSRTRATGGAGLGLAIVRAIARAHGGDATASPVGERGARLRVTLPLAVAPAVPR